jgi:hypothetical protein
MKFCGALESMYTVQKPIGMRLRIFKKVLECVNRDLVETFSIYNFSNLFSHAENHLKGLKISRGSWLDLELFFFAKKINSVS